MTSVISEGFKQSHGYFLIISATGVVYYDIAAGSGAGGSFAPGAATLTNMTGVPAIAAGQILRDMGKTVLVGGIANTQGAASSAGTVGVPTRVFRKVQLLNSTGTHTLAANAPNGVSGGSLTNYFTFYIELPTLGRSGSNGGNQLGGQFTYVNSLPGLYV